MSKSLSLFVPFFLLAFGCFSQETDKGENILDSVESSFEFQHGEITLSNGIGTITVPPGFKYLEPVQAEKVLTEYWGNPKGESTSLGFLLPGNQRVLSGSGYVFNIEYDEIGYVKDDDADEIDFDDLLKDIQKETEEANADRKKAGYEAVSIVGWAAKPFYDKERKILHWAKEAKFAGSPENTLNYNVRILGRKGVLILNAISSMSELKQVQKDIPQVLSIVHFSNGYKYEDFDSSVDEVAAWTLGGLVAGKVLAKVGFFAVILKFWKLIAVGIAGLIRPLWRRIRGRKEEDDAAPLEEQTEEPENEEKAI